MNTQYLLFHSNSLATDSKQVLLKIKCKYTILYSTCLSTKLQ